MLPQKNSKTALPSRSFLVPENRLFVTKPVQSVLGTNSTPKLGAPVTSFGNLLGSALKKNLSASQPNLPPSSSSERPYARRARCAESPEKEKVDRLHPPLRRLTQTRDLYDGLKSEPLKPLSDECVKRNNTKSRNDAPVVWSAQTSGRGSFVSEDWRRRSQHAVAQDTIVGNVNEDTKIAPPDPSLQMISVDHTSFNMKKGINPMPGEISTNFIRLNMKRKGGSYKSKQPNRDVRANPAAMARRDAKTHEFDKSSINNSDEESTPSLSMSAATDRGGLASLGLDPMFIALEALEGTESDAAPRRQPRDQNLRDGLIVNPTPDAAHPVFKVSSSAMICKEICSKRNSVKKKSDKVFNEVKFKRGARIKTMKSTGCIEDEWLEKLAPKCSGHQMPASLLVVKKTGPNKVPIAFTADFCVCLRFFDNREDDFMDVDFHAKNNASFSCGRRLDLFLISSLIVIFLVHLRQDNPELLQLIATEIADEPDIKDTAEKWRQFALLSYHERLSNLDMAQLKREAKIAQARCRYIEQHYGSEQKHSKKIGLSGTKAEITARLTEEALDFLVLESILYEDPLNKRAVVEEDNEFCQEFDDDASIVSSCSTDSSPTNSPKRQCVEREILIFEGAKTEKSRLSKPSGITNSYLPDNNANEAVYLSDSDQNDVLSGSDSDCVEVQSIINNNIIARVLDCTQGAERKRMNVDTVRLLCFGYDSFRTGQRFVPS